MGNCAGLQVQQGDKYVRDGIMESSVRVDGEQAWKKVGQGQAYGVLRNGTRVKVRMENRKVMDTK